MQPRSAGAFLTQKHNGVDVVREDFGKTLGKHGEVSLCLRISWREGFSQILFREVGPFEQASWRLSITLVSKVSAAETEAENQTKD